MLRLKHVSYSCPLWNSLKGVKLAGILVYLEADHRNILSTWYALLHLTLIYSLGGFLYGDIFKDILSFWL